MIKRFWKISLLCLIFLLIIVYLLINNPSSQSTKPLERGFYSQIDIEQELKGIEKSDQETIEYWKLIGQLNLLENIQTSDPIDVALHFAGYPNLDQIPPDKVTVFYHSNYQVTIVVLALGLMDDSVKDREERIELSLENGTWVVKWAGYRQKCQRSIYKGWITGYCP